MNIKKIKTKRSKAFTVIEMLVVAPIVVLVIGALIAAVVTITSQVLSTRGATYLNYSISDALTKISNDVKYSKKFLATNGVALAGTQGYGDDTNPNDTTVFNNVDAVKGDMLILESNATTANPLTQSYIYVYSNLPAACTSKYSNPTMKINIIYFVKNSTLWRRVIMPSNYTTGGCDIPWQLPSCNSTNTNAFCKTTDTKLVDGVTVNFMLEYFNTTDSVHPLAMASDETQSAALRQSGSDNSLDYAKSVKATISATKNISGRSISKTSSLFISRVNN